MQRVAGWAFKGKIKVCIKVLWAFSVLWAKNGPTMVLPPSYMMELHRVAVSKKKWFQERGRPHFLLKWRSYVIDFSRSVRNKNAKSVQSFQEELHSPKETPILIFSRINHRIYPLQITQLLSEVIQVLLWVVLQQ